MRNSIDFLVAALCILIVILAMHAPARVAPPLAPLQSHAVVPMRRGSVIVDIDGDIVSEVLTHEQALREVEKYQADYYHVNPKLKPYGWVDVVVLKSADFELIRK